MSTLNGSGKGLKASLNGSSPSTVTLEEEGACALLYILPKDVDMETFASHRVTVEAVGTGYDGDFRSYETGFGGDINATGY